MSSREQRLALAELVEGVLQGRLTPAHALERMKGWKEFPWNEKLFDTTSHTLHHFHSDEDVREKEPQYAAEQRAYLLKLAGLLRSEAYHENQPVPGSGHPIRIATWGKVAAAIFFVIGLIWLVNRIF